MIKETKWRGKRNQITFSFSSLLSSFFYDNAGLTEFIERYNDRLCLLSFCCLFKKLVASSVMIVLSKPHRKYLCNKKREGIGMTIEIIIKKKSKDPSSSKYYNNNNHLRLSCEFFLIITCIVGFWMQLITRIFSMKSMTGKKSDREEWFTGKQESFKDDDDDTDWSLQGDARFIHGIEMWLTFQVAFTCLWIYLKISVA